MRNALLMATCIGVAMISGCSDDKAATGAGVSVYKYTIVSPNANITATESTISGTGTLKFESPLVGDNMNKINVAFTLEDGGAFKLIANSDSNLKDGIEFAFVRNGANYEGQVIVGGVSKTLHDILGDKIGKADGRMALQIEIHNKEAGEPGAHLIFRTEAGVEIAQIDGDESPGHGIGTFWGIALDKSALVGLGNEKGTEH